MRDPHRIIIRITDENLARDPGLNAARYRDPTTGAMTGGRTLAGVFHVEHAYRDEARMETVVLVTNGILPEVPEGAAPPEYGWAEALALYRDLVNEVPGTRP